MSVSNFLRRNTLISQISSARTLAGARTHEAHKKRRVVLNKYFSKASITKFENMVHSIGQLLCDDLLSRAGTGEHIDVNDAYACLAMDVVSSYCFGEEKGLLDANDFSLSFRSTIHGGLEVMPVGREWPFILDLIQGMPDAIAQRLNPDFARFGRYLLNIQKQIVELVKAYKLGGTKALGNRKSILLDMLQSQATGQDDPIKYLDNEAATILTAGSETVAWTLSVLTYHLLAQPQVLDKVEKELSNVVKNPCNLPKWSELEQLPYLYGVISESLRLSYGLVCRMARIAPDEALVYEGTYKTKDSKMPKQYSYVIPPGTATSILTPMVHHNEDIFPDSHSFVPDRWLKADGTRRTDLEKYLMSFSKGTRQCIGIK